MAVESLEMVSCCLSMKARSSVGVDDMENVELLAWKPAEQPAASSLIVLMSICGSGEEGGV